MIAHKRDIKIAKTELTQVAEKDHEERRSTWTEAIRIFNDNSQALYESPGRLVIDIDETGYKFNVEIKSSGSEGIEKMKIFCFDLMLLQFINVNNSKVDFLVHDSVLFDGVDSRQRALALERAAEVSSKLGGQYICVLNSDMVPHGDFTDGLDLDSYVRLVLTDKEPSGSLLGFQFEQHRK